MTATTAQAARRGTSANGLEFATWGTGRKTLLFIPGGPGSAVPAGMTLRMRQRAFAPYTAAGYRVWFATRRRHMPPGHTVADMADDYARLIDEELGGWADLLVGESYGGMVAQFLAARHPDRVGHLALVVSGCVVSDWGKEVDVRLAAALRAGDRTEAGRIFAEYLLPDRGRDWLRPLVGRLLRRSMLSGQTPREDLLTEIEAELTFDARPVLPHIAVPTLIVAGDRDRFFPATVVEETAKLIPRCTVVWNLGKGHVGVATNRRVPQEVLAFLPPD